MGERGSDQAAVVALALNTRGPWYTVSESLEQANAQLRELLERLKSEASIEITDDEVQSSAAEELRELVDLDAVTSQLTERVQALIEKVCVNDVRLVTVLDDDYPRNLRRVHDRPPFLFTRGDHRPDDARAVAVVGTRQASMEGLDAARSIASALSERDVTVVSGLARGIDTAAHQAALDAGGRTVAVVGTGIERVYPAENRELADRIVESGGAILSQFLPDSPPRRTNFPIRNRTMSGYAVGTVVVEAGATSGAKMQALLALEHNKRLFLMRELVTREAWAQKYAEHPAATVVDDVDDVLVVLDEELAPPAQLTLT